MSVLDQAKVVQTLSEIKTRVVLGELLGPIPMHFVSRVFR